METFFRHSSQQGEKTAFFRLCTGKLENSFLLFVGASILLLLVVSIFLALQKRYYPESASHGSGPVDLADSLPAHPRIILTADRLDEIKSLTFTDPFLASQREQLLKRAQAIFTERHVQYEVQGGRLLFESRRLLDYVLCLGLAYHLTGDSRFRDRVISEIMLASAFPDWHPEHFLDTAEMMTAMALGYDWLYFELTDEQKATVSTAIIEKGLRPAEDAYNRRIWWTSSYNNWNIVCNSALIVASLAIYEEAPTYAEKVLELSRESIKHGMATYDDDGLWPEGPNYWNYATFYNVLAMSALESALGEDFGWSKNTGFSKTGDFILCLTAPSGIPFNFGDAGESLLNAPQLLYLGWRFKKPIYSTYVKELGLFHPMNLLWYYLQEEKASDLATSRIFRSTCAPALGFSVTILRSHWGKSLFHDKSVRYLACVSSSPSVKISHAHADQGSFVLEMKGVRFISDLGSEWESYSIPPKAPRSAYYRINAFGHNTITIDEKDYEKYLAGSVVRFEENDSYAFVILNLTGCYSKVIYKWFRGLKLFKDRGAVLVEDELYFRDSLAHKVVWAVHTRAQAIPSEGRQIQLTKNSEKIFVKILEPREASFVATPATPPSDLTQNPNKGVSKLVISLPEVRSKVKISVVFLEDEKVDVPVIPLADW